MASTRNISLFIALVVPLAAASELGIDNWNWSLPSSGGNGTASASVMVTNDDNGGNSGSIGFDLRLSTAPYGQGGSYYTVAQARSLATLSAGYYRSYSFSEPFDLDSVPAGNYYVVLVLSEYSNGTYYTRDGATASTTYRIGSPSINTIDDSALDGDVPDFSDDLGSIASSGLGLCGSLGFLSLGLTFCSLFLLRGSR